MDVEAGCGRNVIAVRCGPDPRVRAATAAAGTLRDAPTTATGFSPATEVSGVIGEQQWRAIRERSAAGVKLSRIAQEMDLDRKTVRSALRRAVWIRYRRQAAAPGRLDAHRAWLEARAPAVQYSAQILYQELTRERGFTGGYKIVQRAVRPLRAAATIASITQRRFESAAGEQAQCDWGPVSVRFAGSGERTKLHVFVMTLGYSRRGFAMACEHERMADLLAAHEAAFAHFGGRCEHLLYDRSEK